MARSGLAAIRRRSARYKVTILTYPKVLADPAQLRTLLPEHAISRDTLVDHVQWLTQNTKVIGLRDFCHAFLTGRSFVRSTAVLTFDNGDLEVFTTVAPVLENYGLTGTVFLPTDMIGTFQRMPAERGAQAARGIFARRTELLASFPDDDMPEVCGFVMDLLVTVGKQQPFARRFLQSLDRIGPDRQEQALSWFETLGNVPEPDEPARLTWTHARALAETGWELGCQAHGAQPELSETERWAQSYRTVREHTGHAPAALTPVTANPGRSALKAGFLCGVTNAPGFADFKTDLFDLPRLRVGQDNAPDAACLETLLSFGR